LIQSLNFPPKNDTFDHMAPKTKTPLILPPLIFPGKTSRERKVILAWKARGLIYKIGPRLYSSVPKSKLEATVRTSWGLILASLYSKVVISYKTALTYQPDEDGVIYLTSTSDRVVQFPGLTLRFMKGKGADEADFEFMGVRASSLERALLENFASAKGSLSSRRLSQEEIEVHLLKELTINGEARLNKIRDQAYLIATRLGMKLEFKRLEKLIGALLGTKAHSHLKSKTALAQAIGKPYDPQCLERLEVLFAFLRSEPLKEIKSNTHAKHFYNKAFFESYFSNYIEGTQFEIEEAEEIIFDKKLPLVRPQDAHDILATYKIVSDPNVMSKVPQSAQELETLLKIRHSVLFEKRPDIYPGIYKSSRNIAGNTVFVEPDCVEGNLERGFEIYKSLPVGLARAIYMMFLVSDVHPFSDGNGRVSRIMMNAELYSQGLSTIIIPNVYRIDYLGALRAFTRQHRPQPFVKMLVKAHEFSCLDFSNYQEIKKYLTEHFWFEVSEDVTIKLS